MRHTLIFKFLCLYAAIGLAGFILISTLGAHMLDQTLLSSASQSLYREAVKVSSVNNKYFSALSMPLDQIHDNLSAIAACQNAVIMIIGEDGEIYVDTRRESASESEEHEKIEGFDPLALGSGYYSTGSFFDEFSQEMVSVLVPITSNYSIAGYIAIAIPKSNIMEQRETILQKIHIITLIVYLMFLIVIIIVGLMISNPLHKIIQGAKEYASGNLQHKINVKSHDEMGYLSETLNFMSQELNKTGEYQRQFIANVSHDFRSPLTSIRGYAVAMQDGTIPVEMQDRYLGIIVSEADRLNKLTEGLLALNNINDRKDYLKITSFNINAVIKDTAAAFEGACREKKISIRLLLEEDELEENTLKVSADYGKIQQVLYNLLDNAIKFSPNHSVIEIETTKRHGKVFVFVRDQGIGIPKSSLSKIWERFYKIDTSRGKDRKGTGLGLAIVKEIITAHNQKINVVSTEGAGTEFSFTLDSVPTSTDVF